MITITEALAEIKTAQARVVKLRQSVQAYLARDSRLRDPMEKEGGSEEYVRRQMQAIADLNARIVKLRTEIQKVNLNTTLQIGGQIRTLAEWLNWRRDVAPGVKQFLGLLASQIQQARQQAQRQGQQVKEGSTSESAAGDILIAMSEKKLQEQIEDIENVLGTLDGKLSLLNATTYVYAE